MYTVLFGNYLQHAFVCRYRTPAVNYFSLGEADQENQQNFEEEKRPKPDRRTKPPPLPKSIGGVPHGREFYYFIVPGYALCFAHYRMKGVMIVKIYVVRRRDRRYGGGHVIWVIQVVAERRGEE